MYMFSKNTESDVTKGEKRARKRTANSTLARSRLKTNSKVAHM